MTWTPHTTVATIIEQDGKFLMVEEIANGSHVYNQPAGHLDEGESLIDAAIRETLEETAWHVDIHHLVGIYRWQHPQKGITFLRACFTATALHHDTNRELDPDIVQAHWMNRNEIINKQHQLRSPMVIRCIDDYLAGKRYPLDLFSDINEN